MTDGAPESLGKEEKESWNSVLGTVYTHLVFICLLYTHLSVSPYMKLLTGHSETYVITYLLSIQQ